MNRPPSISEPLWATFINIYNASPENRRTVDVPTNEAEAQAAILRMVDAALEARSTTTSLGTEGRPEIFKPQDPPAFQRLADFSSYYTNLRFFMRGVQVSNNRCQQACFLILARWEGPQLASYAQEIDASVLARLDWPRTRESILTWLNEKFRSKTDLSDATARWTSTAARIQKKHFKSGIDFYTAFETELNEFRGACLRAGRTVPNDLEVTAQFVNALPPAIAARVREGVEDLDTAAFETYRSKIARVWAAHQQADIKINKITIDEGQGAKRAFEEVDQDWDEADARAAQTGRRNFGPRRQEKGFCKNSWEKAPQHLQGNITLQSWMTQEERRGVRDRHAKVKAAGVCARCRLPRGSGHLIDTFMPVGPLEEGPRARLVENDEELQQDVEEQS
jgi:hypothetical protein